MADHGQQLIAIGEFSRRTGLTLKALRIYDESGLLKPASVDEWTGYRRYSPEQVDHGRLIALLRGVELPLAVIREVLAETHGDSPDRAVARLESALLDLQQTHQGRLLVIRRAQSILKQESDHMQSPDPIFTIHTRQVPARRFMSIQTRLRADQTDSFVAKAKTLFRQNLGDMPPAGPFTLIFHGKVTEDEDGPLEAALPVPDTVQPSDTVGIRNEPAHEEAYTTITKAQWAFPAILAAYDAVACSEQVVQRSRSPLSCREVYLTDPTAVGDDDPVCDIVFPLADPV